MLLLDELNELFQQVKIILSDVEQRHRSVYVSALDINDFTEAQRVATEAQRNILQVREWKSKLDVLLAEIASTNVLISDIHPVLPTNYLTEKNIQEDNSTSAAVKHEHVAQIQSLIEDLEDGKQEDIYSTEDVTIAKRSAQFSGTGNPKSMKLLGKTYDVSSWNDVYLKVCEVMLIHKPHVIAGLDKNTELCHNEQICFSYIESEIMGNRKRLSNGLWVSIDKDEGDCERLSYGILEKCGYEQESLVIEF